MAQWHFLACVGFVQNFSEGVDQISISEFILRVVTSMVAAVIGRKVTITSQSIFQQRMINRRIETAIDGVVESFIP